MRASFFWRLYLGCVALIAISTAVLSVWIERVARDEMRSDLDEALRARLVLLEDIAAPHWGRERDPELERRLQSVGRSDEARLTIVDLDGRVLADSDSEPSTMENHLHRPEIEAAFASGTGRAERSSGSTGVNYAYLARRVEVDGRHVGIVRVAYPLARIEERVGSLRTTTLVAALASALVAIVIASYFAKRVSAPLAATAQLAERIARGDYEGVRPVDGAEDIRRLSDAIRSMHSQLEQRLATITADRNKVLAILGGMVEGVVAVDGEERVVHLNAVAARVLDVDAEHAVGRRIWEVTRVLGVCEILDESRRSGEEHSGTCRLAAPAELGRGEIELELRASALRDASGAVSGAVVVLHDVTALRRLESLRRDFVANVSHELKTPLTAIRGFVETMLDDDQMEPSTSRRFLERIRDQSMRLSTLVGDLLTLARIESNEGKLERRPVDLAAVLRECAARFADTAQHKGVTLTSEVGPTRLEVSADEESLRQIVDNLLDNACKYTPGGGRVWLRAARADDGVRFEVVDTGIGIDARDQERIFERFYRVDKARSRELGGTGLGLSIVKHLVQSLGAKISLESQVGRGSRFTVHLPHP